jgi:hypothetical protein
MAMFIRGHSPFIMDRMAAKGAEAKTFVWRGKQKHVSTCNLEEWF